MLLLTGTISGMLSTQATMPTGDEMLIEIERITSSTNGHTLGEAYIHARQDNNHWHNEHIAVRFRCDSSLQIEQGEMIVAIAYTKSYHSASESRFERSMARQGFAGEIFIPHDAIISRQQAKPSIANSLRRYAAEKMSMLKLPTQSQGIVEAMSIARKENLSQSTREDFSRSGIAHLLAISGLHISFIFGIAALLFRWLVLFRRGQLWYAAAIITVIWGYTIMAGMTPSVMRAAIMFTLFQLLSSLSQRGYTSENLALTATIMLIADGSTLYDVGFQLSFVAVAAIILWGSRWSHLLSNRPADGDGLHKRAPHSISRRLIHWLWSTFTISLAASIAVLPLTAYHFGTISLWSIVTSPIMIPVGGFIVIVSFIWLMLPFTFLAPIIGQFLQWATHSMSYVAHLCSTNDMLTTELQMSGTATIICYTLMVVLTAAAQKKPKLPNRESIASDI